MSDNQYLIDALSGPTTADVLARMPQPSFWEKYVKPWGSASLAQQEPNWVGKNVLSNPDLQSALMAANFLVPGVKPRIPTPIRAYHGSPHDFEAFDASRIGTGEGAQAFGHGLYFAENPTVARGYRERLAHKAPWPSAELSLANSAFRLAKGDKASALAYFDRQLARGAEEKWPEAAIMQVRGARSLVEADQAEFGRLYEVALHAKPEEFLDWDLPLSQQSEQVQKALKINPEKATVTYDRPSGYTYDNAWKASLPTPYMKSPAQRAFASEAAARQWLDNLDVQSVVGTGVEAAQRLAEAGIPGVRYKDAGSRGKEGGTNNYVVFPGNEAIIEILKKYGWLAPVAAPALSQALASPDQQ